MIGSMHKLEFGYKIFNCLLKLSRYVIPIRHDGITSGRDKNNEFSSARENSSGTN